MKKKITAKEALDNLMQVASTSCMDLSSWTNKHNVPTQLWSQWSAKAKQVYNGTMDQALPNQFELTPTLSAFSHDKWFIFCHNISCLAAWAVDGDVRTEIVDKDKYISGYMKVTNKMLVNLAAGYGVIN